MSEAGRLSARGRRVLVVVALLLIVAAIAAQWWHTRRYERFGNALAALARPGDIHVLMSKDCSECMSARAWLRQFNIAFSECYIEDDAACAASFKDSGSRWTPVLLVRGSVQAGFAPTRIYERLRDRA